jgi:Yip1 domain
LVRRVLLGGWPEGGYNPTAVVTSERIDMEESVMVGEESGLSQTERVVNTFIAPSATFNDILRSTSWWLPFVLLLVSSLGTAVVVDRKVGFDQVYENQVHLSQKAQDRLADMSPEQKAQNAKISVAITKYFTYGGFVIIMIFLALYALLLWVSFNFGLGAKTTYSQVFAVSMYAALPYLLTSILIILSLCFGGNAESYDYKNPVGTSLAYFLPDVTPWLKGLLESLDVVKLWSVVLQVIGMAIIAKKTIAQSAIIVGFFWLIGVLATVAGAAFS